ncbi:MAG: DNA polymerase III subunit alpha [Brumimicrobium sp.]
MYIVFDTETTGLPKDWNRPYTDTDNWPRVVQIAWQLHDKNGALIEAKDYLIKPEGFDIPFNAEEIHGISTLLAEKEGISLDKMLEEFNEVLKKAKFIVGQNVGFDINVLGSEFVRQKTETTMHNMPVLDTCTETTAQLCQIPGGRGGKFKYPTLTELHEFLFNIPFNEAHNATADVEATARSFFELIRKRVFTAHDLQVDESYFEEFTTVNKNAIQPVGLKHINLKNRSAELRKQSETDEKVSKIDIKKGLEQLEDTQFVHLHNYSQFTVLNSTMSIKNLIDNAAKYNMPAIALTDNGNMMGAFHFEKYITQHNIQIKQAKAEAEEKGEPFDKTEILPIIGCEFNVCKNHTSRVSRDDGYKVVILAKNKNGYHNLSKMASIAFTQGKYYVPRIDKKIIEKYKEDLIVLSGSIDGEIPHKILNIGEKQAEDALIWWKNQFKDDFYIEIMRHGQEDEERVNKVLIELARKHDVKLVATNFTRYSEQKDAEILDVLLCIDQGETIQTPIGRGRGFRYGIPNNNYYFRSPKEMKELFADIPDAIKNTMEIVEKCEYYKLKSEILLPAFDIPEEFKDPKDLKDGGKRGENNYLRHLVFEGAKKRYSEVTDEIKDRLNFELETIEKTGYPGYFLIVQDFCNAAREMGVVVGPGRGSAAGSAVAYCTGITNIDPIKYDLLFERFLNPERISMPDIDIDFDDEGRGKVINWVIDKYGENQVAQIITYGTMAAKSSVRDTARVLDLPLYEADRLAKLIPDISLSKLFKLDEISLAEKLKGKQESIEMANELLRISNGVDLQANVLQNARKIEGTMRNTGIHACGVIITPRDITEYVPVALAKDSNMYCTQYDNSVVEEAGLLKMDFLGLKTLTLIKDAVAFVKETKGIDLIPDDFPLDDEKTYELFQKGETVGVFQYESPGMQKYMRDLKPTTFADLIAMNALYRPGPIEYIPSFIKRKNGEQEITYDLEAQKEYLEETYGITVYQEQVMLLSQKLAGFSKGQADVLRKAMGKKDFSLLKKLKPMFLEQGSNLGHNTKILEKIWHDWEAFASYAFNKSHSTCYAWIAYQTAYLKANYPAEYMASVLSNNMNDIKQVTFFMNECRRMGLDVLGPDINESNFKFTVNKDGAIRFGLGAIKGVGEAPVEAIVQERIENGPFKDIFDVTKRVDNSKCNKKAYEGLILSGALDSFENIHRAQYFEEESGRSFITNAIKFGNNYQENQNSKQVSLFGEGTGVESPAPRIPPAKEWSTIQKLKREKEVVGIYISGHPLDDYLIDIQSFCNGTLSDIKNVSENQNREFTVAAILTMVEHRFTKNGDPFGTLTFEDYDDSYKINIFREDYGRFKQYLIDGVFLYFTGKIQPKRFNPNEFEFKILKMDYLSKLRESKAKAIELSVPLVDINSEFIDVLEDVFKENQGNIPIKFRIYDLTNKLDIEMPSRRIKVDLNNKVIQCLNESNIKYKLV